MRLFKKRLSVWIGVTLGLFVALGLLAGGALGVETVFGMLATFLATVAAIGPSPFIRLPHWAS